MYRRLIIITFLILFAAGLLFASTFLQDIFFSITKHVTEFTPQEIFLVSVVFIVLAAFSALLSPFSSTPIVPFAIVIWGAELTTILLLAGWLIGDIIAYTVGRYAGHSILSIFIDEKRLQRSESYLLERMNFFKALLLRLALPAEVGYGFGLLKYPFIQYVAVTVLAESLFAVITVQASNALVALDPIAFLGWTTTLILIIGCFYVTFHRFYRKHQD